MVAFVVRPFAIVSLPSSRRSLTNFDVHRLKRFKMPSPYEEKHPCRRQHPIPMTILCSIHFVYNYLDTSGYTNSSKPRLSKRWNNKNERIRRHQFKSGRKEPLKQYENSPISFDDERATGKIHDSRSCEAHQRRTFNRGSRTIAAHTTENTHTIIATPTCVVIVVCAVIFVPMTSTTAMNKIAASPSQLRPSARFGI